MSQTAFPAWGEVWQAPAKLNLFLHVIGRRADGYHLLQSVFQLIDWCDELRFEPRTDGKIVRASVVDGVPEASDLIIRAAHQLQATAAISQGVSIHITKRLPIGGGLGGGSSDAATTLIALNHLWHCGLSRAELAKIGLTLGADVPFFLFGSNAFAEGIGEALQPIELARAWFVVLTPQCQVPTAEIFRSGALTRDSKSVIMLGFPRSIAGFLAEPYHNDLEAVATALYPPVQQALSWLSRFGQARMSGSGACVFAAFATREQAQLVAQQAAADCGVEVVRSLAQHPHQVA